MQLSLVETTLWLDLGKLRMRDIYALSDEEVLRFFVRQRLLKNKINCDKCGRSMRTNKREKLIDGKWAMVYTAQEKAKCVEWFIEEGKSVAAFSVRYRRELGIHAKVPKRDTILDWYTKFKGQGSVERKKRPNIKTVRTEEKTAEVIDFFKAMPHSSVRWATNVEHEFLAPFGIER